MQRSHSIRLALIATGTSAALAGCSGSLSSPAAASASASATTEAEWIARGEYLTRIAGCNDCHTPGWDERKGEMPPSEWLVGSPLGFTGPWGTTYATNLRTRVAGMGEAEWLEFTRTLTTRPIMPYYNVRAMTEDDRRALYRFIHSLGATGGPAPAYLPPGQAAPPPSFRLELPEAMPAEAPSPGA